MARHIQRLTDQLCNFNGLVEIEIGEKEAGRQNNIVYKVSLGSLKDWDLTACNVLWKMVHNELKTAERQL